MKQKMCKPKGFGWAHAFPHPGMFWCDPPTKEEQMAYLEFMRKRLSKAIERLDEKISKLKAENSETES